MSFRTREEQLAPSEDLSPIGQPGSILFAQPSEVDNWCQSISFSGGFPLTPPDTASDCSLSDCLDMKGPSWTSLPEESWSTVTAPEHSTWMQSSDNKEWYSHGAPVTAQDLHSLDASSWLNMSQGPVDLGLSPVLSHESQISHVFNSISEPETPLLPPGLDLSFIAEPSWNAPGSVVYSHPQVTPEFHCLPEPPSGMSVGPIQPGYVTSTSTAVCGYQQPVFHFQGGQAPGPRRSSADPLLIHRRPLLPRTESQLQSDVHGHSYYRALQPQLSAGCADPASSVSTAQGLYTESAMSGSPSIQCATGQCPQVSAACVPLSPPSDTVTVPRPCISSQACKDFNSLVQYNQDAELPPGNSSYTRELSKAASEPSRAGSAVTDQSDPLVSKVKSPAVDSVANEGDEGRYRSHPLYNEGPQPDGLYHCPFKSDPNCQHKPTKLKCNYDKFVDSHLKPFRCKVEACSKQEFSSTACLLRHEREAHGMHGHGDRPHLCFYPGCERGVLGNGFPRRYNLFDHMKRVHDHKDEPSQSVNASELPGSRKAAGGRKRKAQASVSEEPATRRPKLQHVQQSSPPLSLPLDGYPPYGAFDDSGSWQSWFTTK